MHGFSIMTNHFHIVVTAGDEVPSPSILGDFKSYASRVLNRRYGKSVNGTWWTESGSRRPLPDEKALEAFMKLARLEGIIPALESAHAVAECIVRAPKMDKHKLIIVNLSGRGDKDVAQVAPKVGLEMPK